MSSFSMVTLSVFTDTVMKESYLIRVMFMVSTPLKTSALDQTEKIWTTTVSSGLNTMDIKPSCCDAKVTSILGEFLTPETYVFSASAPIPLKLPTSLMVTLMTGTVSVVEGETVWSSFLVRSTMASYASEFLPCQNIRVAV